MEGLAVDQLSRRRCARSSNNADAIHVETDKATPAIQAVGR
jgi:hypothetical protein